MQFQVFLFSQLWHILDLEDCSWRGLLKSASLLFFHFLLFCPFSVILYGMWLFWIQSRRERTHSCKGSLIWWNESDFDALRILLIRNDFCCYLILLLMGGGERKLVPIILPPRELALWIHPFQSVHFHSLLAYKCLKSETGVIICTWFEFSYFSTHHLLS